MYIVSKFSDYTEKSRHYIVKSQTGITSPQDFVSLAGLMVAGDILAITENYEEAVAKLRELRASRSASASG